MYEDNQLDRIYAVTDGRCSICWKPHSRSGYASIWEVDHTEAQANGGTDYLRNLKLACVPCNRSKRDGSIQAARRENGHRRAPLSTEARMRRATKGALIGAGIGALVGPVGVVAGSALGAIIGHDDDDRPLFD